MARFLRLYDLALRRIGSVHCVVSMWGQCICGEKAGVYSHRQIGRNGATENRRRNTVISKMIKNRGNL